MGASAVSLAVLSEGSVSVPIVGLTVAVLTSGVVAPERVSATTWYVIVPPSGTSTVSLKLPLPE